MGGEGGGGGYLLLVCPYFEDKKYKIKGAGRGGGG